jgi:hypothetical protein
MPAMTIFRTLSQTLAATSFLTGVAVSFGEEMIQAQDQATPCIVLVPIGGPYMDGPGYIAGLDPAVENVWSTRETIDVWCWAFSTSPSATAIDHADETLELRRKVLSAFQDQRNQAATDGSNLPGLYWKPVNGRWERLGDAVNRYGRAYVLTVMAEIAIPMADPPGIQIATITSEQINNSVTGGQHV